MIATKINFHQHFIQNKAMLTIAKRRPAVSINASSMADIAFLLLVFFLVTTTIDIEKGIRVKLPPIQNDPFPPIPARNILSIKINFNDELFVRGEPLSVIDLKDKTKEFIMNPYGSEKMPAAPNQAIISLQNDRSTSFNIYINVYNELKAAYHELWEVEAQKNYGTHFDELSRSKQKTIKNKIPLVISEGEVVDLK